MVKINVIAQEVPKITCIVQGLNFSHLITPLPNTFPLLRVTSNTFHTQFQLVSNTSRLFFPQLPLGLTLFLTS